MPKNDDRKCKLFIVIYFVNFNVLKAFGKRFTVNWNDALHELWNIEWHLLASRAKQLTLYNVSSDYMTSKASTMCFCILFGACVYNTYTQLEASKASSNGFKCLLIQIFELYFENQIKDQHIMIRIVLMSLANSFKFPPRKFIIKFNRPKERLSV